MTLNTRVDLSIGATLQSALDLSSEGRVALAVAKSIVMSDGALSGQAQQLWFDTRTLLASTADNLDLNLSLTNGLGQQVNFNRVKGLFVYSHPANTNVIAVGGGTNPFVNWVADASDIVNVRPGGFMCLVAPDLTAYAVTAGTGDILKVANGAGSSVTYDIVIWGTTS